MTKLYINKRIDTLGRIVIPKDIRKQLHILDNENLDITLEDNKIIIKKTSEDLYNKRLFNIIISIIKKNFAIDNNIFTINKYYYDEVGPKLEEKDMKEFITGKKTNFDKYIIFPIYPNGILFGGIMVVLNKDREIKEDVVACFQKFLEKYLEE